MRYYRKVVGISGPLTKHPQLKREWRLEFRYMTFSLVWNAYHPIVGRFGGGWNWKLGVQFSKSVYMFSLLIVQVTICFIKPFKQPLPEQED